ncbi:MAG: hypothetical protein LBJ02_11815 [Bifidobacteriaceae bacterium]|jgi:hypothetical protein|nr:hypothetical protein [Bifidobacteriaceae bacterium]
MPWVTLAVVGSLAAGLCVPLVTSEAQAAPANLFIVNSTSYKGDVKLDGVCADELGDCTLRAAIEEANDITGGGASIELSSAITAEETVAAKDSANYRMVSNAQAGLISPQDKNAVFHITQPVTIDLKNHLGVYASEDTGDRHDIASFWVDAPNVHLQNLKWVYATGTAVVFSPKSDGSTLTGGSTVAGALGRTQNMVWVMPGADNITISDYKMGRIGNGNSGMIRVAASSGSDLPVKNLTIDGVTFDNSPASPGTCVAAGATGCAGAGIVFAGGVKVNGLRIMKSTFKYMPERRQAIDMQYAGDCSDITIENNSFTRMFAGATPELAVVILPLQKKLAGTNIIRDNTFVNPAGTVQDSAIEWSGPWSNATDAAANVSNLYVEDNYFDGYRARTIVLHQAGAVTVRRNTFGAATGSQAVTREEETIGSGPLDQTDSAMMMNYSQTTNRRILTWYPTQARVEDCKLEVTVEAPTSLPSTAFNYARTPVDLDFYYTAGTTAETYLGTVANVAEAGEVTLPATPRTDGYIRIQTQGTGPVSGGQPESSQYSRTVPVTAVEECHVPQMEIDLRAWQGVPSDATDHDSIIRSGAEILDDGYASSGAATWFTYTVTNTGWAPLTNVKVRDSANGEVCTIAKVERGYPQGCAKQQW